MKNARKKGKAVQIRRRALPEKKRLEGLIQGVNAIRRKTDGAFVMMSVILERAVQQDRADVKSVLEYLDRAREELGAAEYALKSAACVCEVSGEDDETFQRALMTV